MEIDFSQKKKTFAKILKMLKKLEDEQRGLRKLVKMAYIVKDIPRIKEISGKIRENRRKKDGLRELNLKIATYWK